MKRFQKLRLCQNCDATYFFQKIKQNLKIRNYVKTMMQHNFLKNNADDADHDDLYAKQEFHA